jgi:hypothetical protein
MSESSRVVDVGGREIGLSVVVTRSMYQGCDGANDRSIVHHLTL